MHEPIKSPVSSHRLARLAEGLTSIRLLFLLAGMGLAAGLASAYVSAQPVPSQPPAFTPSANPYADGIYANGIVESAQSHGANISIFPEVPGPITHLYVSEGDQVKKGAALLSIDDSVQRQTTAQQKAQLLVAEAQIANAHASLKSVSDTLMKQERSYTMDPQSVSQDTLDTARNSVAVAETSLKVAETNRDALASAAAASEALLAKYTIHAPDDGVVMSIESAAGSYVSTQGAYDPYTQGYQPLIVMGSHTGEMEVRSYIDEILINRLPALAHMTARLTIQGTNISIPLTFERIQPYVSPKIELSDQRLEQVDVRVLPIIFRFQTPPNAKLYPGQLVDVYIGKK
jgi:HlyD family secretion protein